MAELDLPPDPGLVFASDHHRRVVGNLGEDLTTADLLAVLHRDEYTDIWDTGQDADRHALEEILRDVEADGYVSRRENGQWTMTERGFEALNGPNGDEPPPKHPVEAAILVAQDTAREAEVVAAEADRSVEETRAALEEVIAHAQQARAEADAKAKSARDVLAKMEEQMAGIEIPAELRQLSESPGADAAESASAVDGDAEVK